MMRTSLLFVLPALALAACNASPDKNAVKPGTGAGINVAWMDKSVTPGDDFFAYSNGTWFKTTEIPADRSSAGAHVIADELREKNTREMFDAILKANPTSGNDALIANYYNAYFNTDAIDKAGLAPAKADLDAINAIVDKRALSAAIGSTIRADTDPLNNTNYHTENLFGVFVTQGLATPGEQLPYLMQGGIGLPEREYYLSADPKMAGLKAKYRAYVAQLLGLAN
jgi:predicted metalloendopeptidase